MKCGLVVLVALLGLFAQTNFAYQLHYDELLWTKHQLWNEYKLDFPYSLFKEVDEPTIALTKNTLRGVFIDEGLSGPQTNLQQLIQQDLERGKFQPSSFDVTPIEDTASLADVSGVASCKTCFALSTSLWQGVLNHTHTHMQPISAADLIAYGEDLCEYEVPVKILKEWVLLSARVHSGDVEKINSPQQFFMLSARQKQHARLREIQIVKAACKSLLSSTHAAALHSGTILSDGNISVEVTPSVLLQTIAARQAEYMVVVRERGGVAVVPQPSNEPPSTDKNEEEGSKIAPPPPPPPPPQAQRECLDRHPQCEYWAEMGECSANPGYMVGSPMTGWCRQACKVCRRPRANFPSSITKEDAVVLASTEGALLSRIHNTGCVNSQHGACRWIEGNDAKSDLTAAAGKDLGRTVALQQAAVVAGPITTIDVDTQNGAGEDGDDDEEENRVDRQLLRETAIVAEMAFNKAIVPKNTDEWKEHRDISPDEMASEVERVLWSELGGLCIYSSPPNGWWSYEVCYLDSATQFHMQQQRDGTKAPDWIISLGEFESSDYSLNRNANGETAVLFPEGSTVPYVTHVLNRGSECEITGEEGVKATSRGGSSSSNDDDDDDKGDSVLSNSSSSAKEHTSSDDGNGQLKIGDVVLRKSVVRFMCSPDAMMHVTVEEPTQCRYNIDVYVPALCGMEGMEPDVPKSAARIAMEKEKAELKSVLLLARKKAEDDAEKDGEDDDDPYIDPDDL